MAGRDLAKYVIFKSIGLSGAYRSRRRANRDKCIVLTYHGVVPEVPTGPSDFEYRNFVTVDQFDQQLQFLLKHYRSLGAADFIDPECDRSGGFLITFDDGFKNNHDHAMPVLQRHGVQGCFFITAGKIETRQYLWTEEVTLLLETTAQPAVNLSFGTFPLDTTLAREQASQQIRKQMKQQKTVERDETLAAMKSQLHDVALDMPATHEERYLMMTWDEVKGMVSGGQYIGSHTFSHPMLATLSEAESRFELSESKKIIEGKLDAPCELLSYPNGEKENFSDMTKAHLAEYGYKGAFTQIPLYNSDKEDRFEYHRVNIGLKMSLPIFEATICGFK